MEGGHWSRGMDYRAILPLVEPFTLPPPDFFGISGVCFVPPLPPLPPPPPPPFMIILPCISSSFDALTFFGQNNVTKLRGRTSMTPPHPQSRKNTYVHKCLFHRAASSPAAALALRTTSILRPIAESESFRMATFFSRGISSPESLRSFSCFLTGRSSSLVAASSIDGLQQQ